MSDEERRKEAKAQINEERGFYAHLITFVLVNIFLVILNVLTSPNHLWFYWVLLGWGIGLISHGVQVFSPSGLPGKKWEQRRMKQLMDKDEQ